MFTAAQRVVVIQDASREVSSSAIAWARQGLHLKPGDKLTLLSVVHQVNNPSTLSFKGAGKFLGYKSRVDTISMFGANQKIVDEEVSRKKEEYNNTRELMKIAESYAKDKIEFAIEVRVGFPPKMVALQASKSLRATWVILDRQMKKDKKYFMERLSCGISRMKRDNTVEKLRGPRTIASNTVQTDPSRASNVTYDEMLPGTPDDDELFSLEFSPGNTPSPSKKTLDEVQEGDAEESPSRNNTAQATSFPKSISSERLIMKKPVSSSSLGNNDVSSSSLNEVKSSPLHDHEEENHKKPGRAPTKTRTPKPSFDSQDIAQTQFDEIATPVEYWKWSHTNESMTPALQAWHMEEAFENSICSVCKNIRPRIGWEKDFTYAELHAATDGFSANTFLSEGGFGSVYKGKLGDGLKIAVKQHKDASMQGEKEFRSEVDILSKARHRNVVMLLGSCSEGDRRLLVYEYVCNRSLDQHISKHSRQPLSWADRVKIALGAARGLNYLHENNIIHRDMRPENILVTHDHEPLLGDFGLARTQSEESDEFSENIVGTLGYLAPEYAESGRVSNKTDVYSFGVILLELITGMKTTDKTLGEKSLVGWARPLLQERKYPDLIDSRILESHDVHQLFGMVQLAEKCLTKDPEKRLSMDKVLIALTCITNGETVCGLVDFSPTRSDSVSSMPESFESPGDEGMTEQEHHNTDLYSISSASQMNSFLSSESLAYTTKSSRSSASSNRSFFSRKNPKKEGEKPRNRYLVSYGEMLS